MKVVLGARLGGEDADSVVVAAQVCRERGAVVGGVFVHFSAEGVFFAVYFHKVCGADVSAFF